MPYDLLLGVGVGALNGGHVGGSGHIVDDSVQKLLHALIAVGGAAGHGDHVVGDSGLADAVLYLVDGELLALKVFLHESVVQLRHVLHHLAVVFLCKLPHVLGDLLLADILAQIVIVHIGLHVHQVNNALEGVLRADRQLYRDSVALEPVLHHLHHAVEVRAHDVHFVHIRHSGNLILVRLAPYCL